MHEYIAVRQGQFADDSNYVVLGAFYMAMTLARFHRPSETADVPGGHSAAGLSQPPLHRRPGALMAPRRSGRWPSRTESRPGFQRPVE